MLKIKRFQWVILFFLTPALIVYTWFLAIPVLSSLQLSFYTGNLFTAQEYVGLANYKKLFTVRYFSERLSGAFINNVEFFIIIIIAQCAVGLLLALLVTRKFRGAKFFETIYFIPSTISVLVTGFIFKMILSSQWGIFAKLPEFLHLGFLNRSWLGNSLTALPVISLVSAWQYVGIPFLLFTASINSINSEIIEAAKVDGVSEIGLVRYIMIPLLKPIIGVVLVLTYIGCFTSFDVIFAMATISAEPQFATDIFGTYFYRTTFGAGITSFSPDIGLGAAVATIMFIVILIGVLVWLISSKRSEVN